MEFIEFCQTCVNIFVLFYAWRTAVQQIRWWYRNRNYY